MLNLSSPVSRATEPVHLIFDTDLGNDCDDALAMGVIHSLQSRGECELLAVTCTKDHPLASKFADAINTFYGRGEIPIGVCNSGVTPHEGKFNVLAKQVDVFPSDLGGDQDRIDAVKLLRQTLAKQPDGQTVIVQVGFSTNLANLIQSKPDEISSLSGMELVKEKVRLISIMAGGFAHLTSEKGLAGAHKEYNVIKDLESAKRLAGQWPTEIIWSGFEIGKSLPYPHQSILQDYDYAERHPLPEAYTLYNPPPHDRPTWDLTSVLIAVRPDHEYFKLSSPGEVTVEDSGVTTFAEKPDGRDRYLILDEDQKTRITEALTLLSSQPPM
ncbi:MAG: nucleoside hydrolase [Planctomycetota bacterium]